MSGIVSYAITVGRLPARALQLLSFSGREAISELYCFDVAVTSSLPEALLRRVALGQRARLAMRVAGKQRIIHGIVSHIREDGTRVAGAGGAHDVHRFRLTLVPRAWLLRKRKGSHIFQDQRIDQVIDEVCGRLRVATRWELDKPFPQRPYCTQFEETDYELVCRLCAENGVWFRFEQAPAIDDLIGMALDAAEQALPPLPLPDLGSLLPLPDGAEGETLVLSNHATYPPILDMGLGLPAALPTLHYQDASGALAGPQEDFVTSATLTKAITSTGAVYREYDPLRPLAPLESHAGQASGIDGLPNAMGAEITDAIERLGDLGIDGPLGEAIDGLDIYEHDGNDLYPDWELKKEEPKQILEQHRRRRSLLEGTSHAVRLEAGRCFTLDGHSLAEANGDYAVIEVQHEGTATFHHGEAEEAAQPYLNQFTCVPREVAYLPQRPPRRSVQVCMTALVVGPAGEEIHVNERGEIKVKFYWDRRDERHEPTCWIRTMHPWAGAGWGFQFIPRIGMEAVVVFEGGDPDRPLVTGCVYNGVLPPPFQLPGYKTQSGIRTRSTPNSQGHNELMFQDAAGDELVYLRAERDQHDLVQHDRKAEINHQDRTDVGDDQHLQVGGEQHVTIHRDRNVQLLSSDTVHVKGTRHLQVDELLEERVRSRSLHVAEKERREILGSSQTIVHGSLVTLANGSVTLQVGQSEAPKSATLNVEGSAHVSAMKSIEITADKDITLRVGKSFVRISEKEIQLSAETITVQGKDGQIKAAEGDVKVKAKGKFQAVADAVALKASGAALGLKSDAVLDGAKVLLNSPEEASDSVDTSEPDPAKLEVVDQDGQPLAYQRYLIVLDGGGEQMGYLDENGKAEVHLSGAGRVTFPDLAEVEES
jgi:type VI secretion system secreted protein VgrG